MGQTSRAARPKQGGQNRSLLFKLFLSKSWNETSFLSGEGEGEGRVCVCHILLKEVVCLCVERRALGSSLLLLPSLPICCRSSVSPPFAQTGGEKNPYERKNEDLKAGV